MSNESKEPPAPNYVFLEERFDAGSGPRTDSPITAESNVPSIALILLRLLGLYWIFESFPALSMIPQFIPSVIMGSSYINYSNPYGPSFFFVGLGFLGILIKFVLAIALVVWTHPIASWLGRPYLLSRSQSRSNH